MWQGIVLARYGGLDYDIHDCVVVDSMDNMILGDSVKNALDKTKKNVGECDPYTEFHAVALLYGDDSFSFYHEIGDNKELPKNCIISSDYSDTDEYKIVDGSFLSGCFKDALIQDDEFNKMFQEPGNEYYKDAYGFTLEIKDGYVEEIRCFEG